uniref:Phospholipid scramblase n=1 Tax=Calcidiscus leptoporus TaxID=127549 RepID=A0A7S0P2R7_9EUKA|mmetsp:Transcript_48223/g.111655  ORF Transcript_48223/g.111655 Transcript_48223/m.111655 type:complete len:363 (+) Transcript_48223:191-1279(+)|eukprot:CAMPEP_0119380832 /NCGR_PEP_ID=MMETSP1334-20130426/57947_1 /TAXON_ID=127549 /ORGANISM="Calcidiscus leptoporus, Strain RCC1130" /LENGTH=362 /DNA_ID=CAMNT_0007400773 /DNA_START=175 /DNA_END=1263 /DNA_ORIENTATION=+
MTQIPVAYAEPVAPLLAVPAVPVAVPSGTAALQGVPSVHIGPQDQVPLLDSTTAGILANVSSFTIKQRVKWWEALTQGCIEQANTYDIFDNATGAHLFIAQEVSDDCTRCCCAPHHNVRVDFRLVNSQERLWQKGEGFQTVMSMERQGCGDKCCLGCCICSDSCKDGFYLQAGGQVRQVGEVGPTDYTIGYAQQPDCGGYFTPTINLFNRTTGDGGYQPIAKIEGPCLFGGCSELCCSSSFPVSSLMADESLHTKKMLGNLAIITKEKPRNCKGCARELFTDSDSFTLTYKEGIGLTPQQKATMMAGLLLADYMLFEQDNGMCECKNNALYITFFDYYCCGCVGSCSIKLQNNNSGGGGGGE